MKATLCALLLSCSSCIAVVGEKYEDFVARVGKGKEPNTRGEATMYLHTVEGKGVLVVVVGGIIATEAYEAVDFDTAKALVAKVANGTMFETGRLHPRIEWRTQDGTYRAEYRSDAKLLRLYFWRLYAEKVAKESAK